MTGTPPAGGHRVLLVEDQFIIAFELERTLTAAGCEVVGPIGRLQPALEMATTAQLDFAVLDVNLFGERVFPVAAMLQSRGIPFLLTTGYGEAGVPAGEDWQVVSKPYDAARVTRRILEALAG